MTIATEFQFSAKRPAIFFDRDNTLIVSDGYLGDPAGVVLVSGAAQTIAGVKALGFAVVVVSNQSGVARGMFDEEAVHSVNRRLNELLIEQDPAAIIDLHEFCPYHPDAIIEKYRKDSPLRKPAPGMIIEAAKKLHLDLARSWLVGDAPRDIEAGKAAGCQTILYEDPSLPASPAANQTRKIAADHHVSALEDALNIIQSDCDNKKPRR